MKCFRVLNEGWQPSYFTFAHFGVRFFCCFVGFFLKLHFTHQYNFKRQLKFIYISVYLQEEGEGNYFEFVFSSAKGKVRKEKCQATKQGNPWAGVTLETD